MEYIDQLLQQTANLLEEINNIKVQNPYQDEYFLENIPENNIQNEFYKAILQLNQNYISFNNFKNYSKKVNNILFKAIDYLHTKSEIQDQQEQTMVELYEKTLMEKSMLLKKIQIYEQLDFQKEKQYFNDLADNEKYIQKLESKNNDYCQQILILEQQVQQLKEELIQCDSQQNVLLMENSTKLTLSNQQQSNELKQPQPSLTQQRKQKYKEIVNKEANKTIISNLLSNLDF